MTPAPESPDAAQLHDSVEYGATDYGFTFAGLPLTEGDKRLAALLTHALGNDHPAFNDLVALFFAARGAARPALAADTITRLTAERDAARRDAERLREALTRVLDTREAEAKAWFTAENARNNFSGGAAAEEKAHLRAMHVASVAEKAARAALSAQERGNV